MFRISPGQVALSSFRLAKLRAILKARIPNVFLEDTRYWYFSALKGDALATDSTALLDRILGIDATASELNAGSELQRLLVVPRLGTISPWSSKATDIAQHCGLSEVQRIERGVVYFLQTRSGEALTQAELKDLLPLLHDRITESVLFDFNGAAEKIFRHTG